MCGRYALGIRAAFVRHQLQTHDMPVEEAPEDDEVRETYNFAPGYHGLVYRADVPDWGAGGAPQDAEQNGAHAEQRDDAGEGSTTLSATVAQQDAPGETRYKLQKMKWGLVPFWTKRNPDYKSLMRSINARDDSLAAKGGMWQTMKQKKRCIVVAQGFYEWLKKDNGKQKIPHFTKRKDGQLMLFAGLWDCVKYEDTSEKNYTYTIITTDSNEQLSFLHDRMPVILENGSDQIRTWLDPKRVEWSKELQSLLKPFKGELECYPVSSEVGKAGNNSPQFIVPVTSSENKNNIANFFGGAKKDIKGGVERIDLKVEKEEAKHFGNSIKQEADETRQTIDHSSTEDNAPLPVPASMPSIGIKREHSEDDKEGPKTKAIKKQDAATRMKSPPTSPSKKTRSATSNLTAKASPTKADGSQKITNFLKK
ncbi:uncharacterized protein KY384_006194 [Bacidia gigantensis]|uniref:uncharacterized protein n=1 Tax=Bacidia gigantensis TaxID=2732470 RepID=UPI001D03C110|nr:uncharacterized protein KY384_006194 [Bacidia gigantensis]KAG8529557.1 hypothetical protein KY384_006194 [Bacidia gigantensis]